MSFVLLGILNSQAAGGARAGYDLLESTRLISSTSSVTFAGLDSYSDYKHLQIRVNSDTNSAGDHLLRMTFNNDTGANYAYHFMRANGSALSSFGEIDVSSMIVGRDNNNGGLSLIDITDFNSTNKRTTVRSLGGNEEIGLIYSTSNLYNNTNAITSIELFHIGEDFGVDSTFALYGIGG